MSNKPEPVAVLLCICGTDRADWADLALSSLLAQDYRDGDIRIYLGVDGPLTAPLDDWLRRSTPGFYKVLKNEANLGLSKTLNRLIAALEDERYIFRMDADDLSLPWRFRSQVNYLRIHPDIDVVGGAVWEFDDGAEVAWLKVNPLEHETIRRYIMRANPFTHSSVCFRRAFFTKVAGYSEGSRYNQDLALWFKALQKGVQMANLPCPVLCLRTSPDFYRRRGFRRSLSELYYYLAGTWHLRGLSWNMAFPLARFFMRLLPSGCAGHLYRSSWRRRLTHQTGKGGG